MATIDIWIQLENRSWDVCPSGFDRMDGKQVAPAVSTKTIRSPEFADARTVLAIRSTLDLFTGPRLRQAATGAPETAPTTIRTAPFAFSILGGVRLPSESPRR
jgi:hypothetical protein